MMSQQRIRLVVILVALVSLCQPYDCVSYKQLLHGRRNGEKLEEAAKLIRVKLTKNHKPDSFEDLSRSLQVFQENDSHKMKHLSLNSHLVGSVGIGNPVQEFKFIFDTLQANMWVSTLNCRNCGSKKRYNSSASTTYIKDGKNITTNNNLGSRSIDQVSFGDVVIKNQTFAEVYYLTDFSAAQPYDGLFCLGLDNQSVQEVVTPLRQMLDQGLIESEVFAIYQGSTGGEIVFGGLDKDHYTGSITWTPNVGKYGWTFKMDSLTLKGSNRSSSGGETVCENGCNVNIRTYLPYIFGPPEDVSIISEAMGAEMDQDEKGLYVLPDCDLSKLSNLVFKINGVEFELTPEQYVQKVNKGNETVCVSLIKDLPVIYSDDIWFFGTSFVGHIYTAFDYENGKIGFAHAK